MSQWMWRIDRRLLQNGFIRKWASPLFPTITYRLAASNSLLSMYRIFQNGMERTHQFIAMVDLILKFLKAWTVLPQFELSFEAYSGWPPISYWSDQHTYLSYSRIQIRRLLPVDRNVFRCRLSLHPNHVVPSFLISTEKIDVPPNLTDFIQHMNALISTRVTSHAEGNPVAI